MHPWRLANRILLLLATLVTSGGAQQAAFEWGETKQLDDIGPLQEAFAQVPGGEDQLRREPVLLAYRSAVFLATGQIDSPQAGELQNIQVEFGRDAGGLRSATVEVQLVRHLPDGGDARAVRLQIKMSAEAKAGAPWVLRELKHSRGKRKPVPARAPESGKFSDFLQTARHEARFGRVPFTHEKLPAPLKIGIYGSGPPEPVDPLVLSLKGELVEADATAVPKEQLGRKLAEYKTRCELVAEKPLVMLKSLSDVGFDDGVEVLATIAAAGLEEIVLEEEHPHGPGRGPAGPPPTQKPRPPAELFPGRPRIPGPAPEQPEL